MFNHPEYYDIPATQALLMQKMTLDKETGLMYHAYDEDRRNPWADPETGLAPEFWGRSIGWVPVAIMEELDYIPEDHPKYQALVDMVRNLLISLCKFQSEEGRWYQVVNKGHMPDNWLENSCSCLYTAALCAAVRKGILDKSYLENAKKGYQGVINSLTWEGDDIQIGNVCIGTGVGNYEHYINRPVCTNDLHGVGAFLIMCAEMQAVWEE
jgi:unsaturated rhamnogalacturonyl hydrolase